MNDGQNTIDFGQPEPKPNYLAVIPAEVRYDKRLSSSAILLYGELVALSNKQGYAWPTNRYFADLYSVRLETVSRWLTQLEKARHIEMIHERGGRRRIYPLIKNRRGLDEKIKSPCEKDQAHLNEEKNEKKNRGSRAGARPPFSIEEAKKYGREIGLNSDQVDEFWDRQTAKGWRYGPNKIVDGEAALRTWKRMEVKFAREKQKQPPRMSYGARESKINKLNQQKAYWMRQPESKKRSRELEQIRVQLHML